MPDGMMTKAAPAAGVFDARQPYSAEAAADCIATIREHLPMVEVIRTDRIMAGPITAANQQRAMLEIGNKRYRIGLLEDLGANRSGYLARDYGLTRQQAVDVVEAAWGLSRLNSIGAWCTQADAIEPFVVSRDMARGKPIAATSYIGETCEILAEELPGVSSIDIDYNIKEPKNGKGMARRRAFLRFNGPEEGCEVASLDSAGIAVHARSQILRDLEEGDAMDVLDRFRMEWWAGAMQTHPDHLAEVMPTLVFFTSVLHVTRIELR